MAVLITGGTRGIGLSIAKLLHSKGRDVVLLGTNPNNLDKAMKALPGSRGIQCDVSDSQQIREAMEEVETSEGKVSHLVNCAGIAHGQFLAQTPESVIRKIVDVNLVGPLLLSKAFTRYWLKHSIKGHVLNITSVLGSQGMMGAVTYSATKGGLIGLTKCLAVEMGPMGIRVNAIAPGVVETDLTKDIPDNIRKGALEGSALNKFVSATEIAKAAEYLLNSSDVTGTVLTVDAGLSPALLS